MHKRTYIYMYIYIWALHIWGFAGYAVIKNLPANAGDLGLIPELARSPGEATPVFLPGESHGQRSLVGCGPYSLKESDTTEAAYHICTCIYIYTFKVPWWLRW